MPHAGTQERGPRGAVDLMKKAASVRDCAAQPRNGRPWLNNY